MKSAMEVKKMYTRAVERYAVLEKQAAYNPEHRQEVYYWVQTIGNILGFSTDQVRADAAAALDRVGGGVSDAGICK